VKEALEPFDREDGENPYTIQHDLQEMMQTLVASSAPDRSWRKRS